MSSNAMNTKRSKPWLVLLIGLVVGVAAGASVVMWQSQTPAVETSKASVQPAESAMPQADKLDKTFFVSSLAEPRDIDEVIPLMGRLAFNAEKIHLASARIAGRLDRILVFEGMAVKQGQALAALYSPEYISAQNELLLARNTWRTLQASAATQSLAEDAEGTLQSARERMRVMGASEADIQSLERDGQVHEHLLLRAPISGIVTERNLSPGAFINLGDSLMSIADTSSFWFYGNVYEQDYQRIHTGQTLRLQLQALPNKQYSARVDLLAPQLDTDTNTLRVRCLVHNDGNLRADLFGTASLKVGKRQALLLPVDAVVRSLQVDYLIVETADGNYRKRQVEVLPYDEARVAVISGLQAHEKVVIKGATLLNQKLAGAA
ncbi:efflux RND transporter periplasmic adaptor subunit [Methylobacillus glycogenes]|uniref:efflux RND transporter periplasmic adaptor subunit n=1 Tax=Methylobacillus glycogenes TaxID=406 RepID=UPI000470047B|nr:efflux RND transporter periplasmic adaptor subunit [Methylobacillus glycogenes]